MCVCFLALLLHPGRHLRPRATKRPWLINIGLDKNRYRVINMNEASLGTGSLDDVDGKEEGENEMGDEQPLRKYKKE